MSQDNLIKLQSEGIEIDGVLVGKGHIIYSHKNKRLQNRLRLKKFNPVARTHTWYKETK
jgi:ribosomal protein L33